MAYLSVPSVVRHSAATSRGVRSGAGGRSMAAAWATSLMLCGSGATVGEAAAGGPLRRPEGDGQPGEGADQVQAVVGTVERQEVDVGVAGGQQPAVESGGVQPPPHRQPGQADGQVDQVVQAVDLKAEQGLVALGGEVVEAGD